MNPSPTPPAVTLDLEIVVSQNKLSPESAQSLREAFSPHFARFHELAPVARTISEDSPKAARAMRLELRGVRIAAEHTRKELGEDALRRKKAVDGVNNVLLYALVPIEEQMEKIERAEEIRERQRKAELKESRAKALEPYGVDPSLYLLDEMPDHVFDQLLLNSRTSHEMLLEAHRKAEEERIAREAAKRAYRERILAENESLKQEAVAREAAAVVERQKAKEIEDCHQRELVLIDEKARKERLRLQAIRDADREALEQAEAELKKLGDQRMAERQKKLAEERAAAAAPDREKMIAFAAVIRSLPIPEFSTQEGKDFVKTLAGQLDLLAGWIEFKAGLTTHKI